MVGKGVTLRHRMVRHTARGVGVVALVFSLTVATLLTIDVRRTTPAETVRSEVLSQALAASRAEQHPDQVRFAREMDRLARRAYFSSLTFRRSGILLLIAGLLTTAACFGVAWRLRLEIPDPREIASHASMSSDRLALQVVFATGIALVIAAVVMSLTKTPRHPAADAALRAQLVNPEIKPGESHVCPCRRGTTTEALATQWPFLRGPTHSGRTALTQAPLVWNGKSGAGITWKTALPAGGASTPVVWQNRIFLTLGTKDAREVLAYDIGSGEMLWRKTIPDGAQPHLPLPDVMDDTGLAASTPACDERQVYAVFGTGDLVALTHGGAIVWQRFLGRPANTYGHASSLVYCGEMLIVQWDQEKEGRILAIDKKSGKTLWETPRQVGMSWSTPILMPGCDTWLLLVHATHHTWGMELATGRKLWEVDAVGGEVAPSPTWEGDRWLAANCYSHMAAFRVPAEGEPEMLWKWDDGNLPDVASPLILDGLVYLVTDAGEVMCHDLEDGTQLWYREFEDGYYASPIAAANRIYIVDRAKGLFRVYAAGREAKELAQNPMGEAVSATPAFVENRIIVRGAQHLWCIAQ